MIVLNLTVVLDDNAVSYLKFDSIGRIFAIDPSGGSGSSSSGISCPGSAPTIYDVCDNGVWKTLKKTVESECAVSCGKWYCANPCVKQKNIAKQIYKVLLDV